MTLNVFLEELVLGYFRQVDGLVEPPAYGTHEVLLPEEVVARWGINSHQRFAFAPGMENALYLHFGHPLVETIVEELRTQAANGRFFINNVHLEKPGVYEVIEKTFSVSNARMFPVAGVAEEVRLHHYARLNFKVSLIADEKREQVLPLWMDVQGGFSVPGGEIERVAILDGENSFPNAPLAALAWSREPPLSFQALEALLERARSSAALELGETLHALQKRLARFLELDRARLNHYYDDLNRDITRRLEKAEEERRPALEVKRSAIASERASKLADVEQKYHLRLRLELINLAIIAQPKLDLMVEIRKRGVNVKRRVSWDPLLHAVEGLACDVCGRPGHALSLCENGHLVHAECLAPQCVDCKRTYCQKCAGEVQTCVVCDRPVCLHSLNRCAVCGRGTCQEHREACHAENGQPRKEASRVEVKPKQEAASETQAPAGERGKSARQRPPGKMPSSRARAFSSSSFERAHREETGDFMEVYMDPAISSIVAYVMAGKHEVATRKWTMSEMGIAVDCWCEKPSCSEQGKVYRPAEAENLVWQMNGLVQEFAWEYGVPEKKIRYFHVRQEQPFVESKLRVPARWKEPATLERAWAGFEALRKRNTGERR